MPMLRPTVAPLLLLLGCTPSSDVAPEQGGIVPTGRPEGIHPWVLLGVDGLDPRAVADLLSKGMLPNLKRLCDEGVCLTSSSAWASSPVIWTTIATGVVPERHGIDRFVTETQEGRVPIGSRDRKVAALWDVASQAGYRTALLGWLASYPAYDLRGVYMSDRSGNLGAPDRMRPASLTASFDAVLPEVTASRDQTFDHCEWMGINDSWVSHWTPKVVAEGHDVVFSYLRCVDVVSHPYWGYYWKPETVKGLDLADVALNGQIVPNNYRAADQALGNVLAALQPDTNLIVMSDHGFEATKNPQITVRLNTDLLLQKLGFAEADDKGAAVPARSRAILWHTPPTFFRQKVRFQVAGRDEGGTVAPGEVETLKAELKQRLKTVKYATGQVAVEVREPEPAEVEAGADVVIQVLRGKVSQTLHIDGVAVDGLVGPITMNTGDHHPTAPPGWFLAWGPDIDPAFPAEAMRVQDVAPTLAYGLGLPVAEDTDGAVVEEMFTAAFRAAHPMRTVASWGAHDTAPTVAATGDETVIRELQTLGYIE